MRLQPVALILLLIMLIPAVAFAGFTETLPQSTWLLDTSFVMSTIESKWNNQAEQVPLIDDIERYEPGAGLQGIMKANAKADLGVLALQLHYGILDNLLLGVGVPIFLYSKVDPRLSWEEGHYQWNLGRQYSEQDFWEWAASMGQPKPEKWEGNEGVLSDIIIAGRYRFTDGIEAFEKHGLHMALLAMVALPTGQQADEEELVTAGTTTWELHAGGDIGLHIGLDKTFEETLDGRMTLGWEVFHEILLPHKYKAPSGKKNPLMLNYSPYIGKYYTIDGGDFTGASFQVDVVPLKGPALPTWLVKGDASKAEELPPLFAFSVRYTYQHLQQTNFESESPIWDWEQEEDWRPGLKQILWGQATISLLRVGVPMQPYFSYRNLTWLPGKNARAPNVMQVGTRFLLKFW